VSIVNEGSGASNGDPRAAAASAGQNGWNMHDGGLFNAPIPRGMGSEYYNSVKTALIEIYKLADRSVDIGVVELSRATDPALDFSCILVATRLQNMPELGVAVYIILLAETGEEIQPYSDQIYDRTVMIYRVPSDAINDILVRKARRIIETAYNTNKVLFVDGTVVNSNFNPVNKTQVHRLALTAAMAGVTELNSRTPGFKDLNLANLNKRGQAQVDVTFARQTLEDAAGNVYRSDVLINFSDRKVVDRDSRQMNTGDRNANFSTLSSFVDAVWFPAQDPNGGLGQAFAPQQMAQTRKFVARQVITDITANVAQTTASVLLALSTALALRPSSNWIQAFRPMAVSKKELDITDPGAYNYEGNLPVPQPSGILATNTSGFGLPIDTKSDDFKSEQLGMYIAALFNSDLMISMDIPEYGPQTHYLSVFMAAARGVDGAYKRIIQSANELTNGEYAKHFQMGTPLFATQSERIHAGTWVDNQGNKRDLRDFDYAAVANIVGQRNPAMIREWSDTFLRLEYPENLRLEARRKMLMQLSNDTAKFTGYYQRVTFTGAFLSALDAAIATQNLQVNIRTPMSGNDFYNARGVATYAQQALLGTGQSYMRQGGYGSTPAAASAYFQARW